MKRLSEKKIIELIRVYKKEPTLENFEDLTVGLRLETVSKNKKN